MTEDIKDGKGDCGTDSEQRHVMRRCPIVLNKHTVMLIHLFNRHDRIEDLWMSEADNYQDTLRDEHREAAEQLLSQLEDHWTPAFMMALREGTTKWLKQHDKDYGTNFA